MQRMLELYFAGNNKKLCCLHAHVVKSTVDLCTEKKKPFRHLRGI